jgi:hypothetical protein
MPGPDVDVCGERGGVTDLHIRRHSCGPEELREPALRSATKELQLPEAVLRDGVTESGEQRLVRLREHMRHAIPLAIDDNFFSIVIRNCLRLTASGHW